MITTLIISFLLLAAVAFYCGRYYGTSRVQAMVIGDQEFRLKNLREERDILFDMLDAQRIEQNNERKLWTNKAQVRAGGPKIFPDSLIFPELTTDTGEKQPEDILEPPSQTLSGRRASWRNKDTETARPDEPLPLPIRNEIEKDLEDLSSN